MFPGFDPTKLDPKLIHEITDLMRTLPPDQLMKMQGIMHNSMAGFDVSKDMRDFENGLPPGFRERMARIMYQANGIDIDGTASKAELNASPSEIVVEPSPLSGVDEARLTILKAVRNQSITPEEALKALFP